MVKVTVDPSNNPAVALPRETSYSSLHSFFPPFLPNALQMNLSLPALQIHWPNVNWSPGYWLIPRRVIGTRNGGDEVEAMLDMSLVP